jgi:magnesium transporter
MISRSTFRIPTNNSNLPGRRGIGRWERNNEAEAQLARISLRSQRVSALTDRLEEALVFIIHDDSRREFETMTLRQLYNYVLKAIATRPEGVPQSSRELLRATASSPQVSHGPPVLEVNRDPIQQSFVSSLGSSRENSNNDLEDESNIPPTVIEEGGDNEEKNVQPSQEVGDVRQSKQVTFDAPPTKSRRRQASVDFSASAGVVPCAHAETITYRERLGGYLHPRDMRRLVTPFSTTNAPEIMVRRHVILLNCDPLRAIVLRDRLLLLVPDGADSILEMLGKRILGGREEMENSVFGAQHEGDENVDSSHKASSHPGKRVKFPGWTGHGKSKSTKRSESGVSDATVDGSDHSSDGDVVADEWDDLEGRGWIDMPFELKAVDAVLHTVSIMLSQDVDVLQEAVYDTIEGVLSSGRARSGDHAQQLLRAFKNEIKEMSSRVDNFVRAINESLDDLEDLSLMNLSRLITHPERFIQPVPEEVLNEESDEPELILEVYLQQALSIFNQLDLLQGQVTTSEELMAMQLDTVRNRLLYINAVLSTFTLTVTCAALVGSIYGMNVKNPIEDNPSAFQVIVTGTALGCFAFLVVLLFVFYRALSLPNISAA